MTSPTAQPPPEAPPGDDHATTPGLCPVCWSAFTPTGRQIFCGDHCRKTAWRRRHQDQPRRIPTIPAGRPRRDVTIYQCEDCDTRYHGQQWCDECNRPCRRIGLGGTCPNCDEPVSIADLLETPAEVHIP